MISTRIISVVAALMIAGASAAPASAWGERKNQAPFVRTSVTHPFVSGEPKNEPPFTNPVGEAPTVIVAGTQPGFRWADAAIGAGAGIGAVFVAAGLAALALTTRRKSALAQ
jgi:hypothetical protein